MSECVRETICTRCLHREVCKFKDEYLGAVLAIDRATVHTEHGDGRVGMRNVRDIPCIGAITIECIHHMEYSKGE